jgi:hypothetical protein
MSIVRKQSKKQRSKEIKAFCVSLEEQLLTAVKENRPVVTKMWTDTEEEHPYENIDAWTTVVITDYHFSIDIKARLGGGYKEKKKKKNAKKNK